MVSLADSPKALRYPTVVKRAKKAPTQVSIARELYVSVVQDSEHGNLGILPLILRHFACGLLLCGLSCCL